MRTPLPIANLALVVSATLFGMALLASNPVAVFQSVLALFFAGQLVGAAKRG
ncbi:MAG TPA: hypothetical protein VLA97_11450 [Nocardioidaceae bacterium]|jgi:hypothetical protein|nr:hypothetical protein [Nocardioidaceae bacterium]